MFPTERAYHYSVRFFIRWSGLRHLRDMGKLEVEAFLSILANERRASASTHRQALNAILFLYREVLDVQLPWIGRPTKPKRIPEVPTREPADCRPMRSAEGRSIMDQTPSPDSSNGR